MERFNESKETNTSLTSQTLLPPENDIDYHFIILPGMTAIFNLISLSIMIKAPRIAKNIRYMCSNIIFYNLCFLTAFVLHNCLQDYPKWFYRRATQYSVVGQYVAISGFSVERLLAISSPYKYRAYCKTIYVKVFIFVELICFSAIISFSTTYNWERKRAIRVCWGASSLYTALTVICIFCSVKALIIYKSSLSKTHIKVNRLTERVKIVNRDKEILSVFCLLFVVLRIPTGVEIIVYGCDLLPTKYLYTIYVILFNTVIDPFIYIWRFRECRLQGLQWLSQLPCFRFLENYTEMRRMEIFNIPTAERRISERRSDLNEMTSRP